MGSVTSTAEGLYQKTKEQEGSHELKRNQLGTLSERACVGVKSRGSLLLGSDQRLGRKDLYGYNSGGKSMQQEYRK